MNKEIEKEMLMLSLFIGALVLIDNGGDFYEVVYLEKVKKELLEGED